jgi:hypothetical protein
MNLDGPIDGSVDRELPGIWLDLGDVAVAANEEE